MRLRVIVGAFCAAVTCAWGASAAEIEFLDLPGDVDIISIEGEITDGDGSRFAELIQGRDRISVVLQSPGGLVKEALQIGTEIRLNNYATMVPPDGECFSACGLIWVSGARRFMSPTSRIGFHAAYREENGEYRESGVANAEIGSYLTHLGLRIEAIRFFTIAGPNEFLLLSPDRARVLGIDIFEQDGTQVTTPAQAPSVDIYADRFVSYGLLRSLCSGFFKFDDAIVQRAHMDAIERGQAMAGNEAWIKVWTLMLEQAKAEVNTKGALLVCLETEAHLRGQGLSTGIDGPSYACSKAATATEKAMCSHPDLWAKDRAMSSIYFWIRNNVESSIRKPILAVQRKWLVERNACGGDMQCLNNVFDRRFQELKTIDIPS